jgi:transmembrane sensor
MSRWSEAHDRAARWIVAQEDSSWSDMDQVALESWLREADGNKAAYWRLKHSWREADRICALGDGAQPIAERRMHRRTFWLPAAVAASIAAIAIFGYHQALNAPERILAAAKYETAIGGQKLVGLPDGSRVKLNTASKMRTAINAEHREVWLDKGEAYFEVAHINGRPFIVHAGNRTVTVLGTKFSVRRDGNKTTVVVLEGRVRIDDIMDKEVVNSTIVSGGDIALVQGRSTLVAKQVEDRVEDVLKWRDGMLFFDQERLADIAIEFNRYNRMQLIIADPEVAEMRIGGKFPASSPSEFAHLLRDAYGLNIRETQNSITISN